MPDVPIPGTQLLKYLAIWKSSCFTASNYSDYRSSSKPLKVPEVKQTWKQAGASVSSFSKITRKGFVGQWCHQFVLPRDSDATSVQLPAPTSPQVHRRAAHKLDDGAALC